jgi:hypothetical protein
MLIICLITGNISSIASILALTFEVIPAAYVFAYYCKKHYASKVILDSTILAATIQGIIALIAFLFPSVQDAIISKFIQYGMDAGILYMIGWRMYGFSYTLAYACPVVQAIMASVCLYLGINKKSSYLFYVPLLAFSTLINARAGMVVLVIGFFTVFVTSIKLKAQNVRSLLIGVVILLIAVPIMSNFLSETTTAHWLKSGIEETKDFLSGQRLGQYSYFNYLTNRGKYQLPNTIEGILFGTGHITRKTSAATDIGFINDIWLGGLIYCLFISLFFIKAAINIVFSYIKERKTAVVISAGLSIALILCDFKGQCFGWNEISVLVLLFYVFCLYEKEFCKPVSDISIKDERVGKYYG